jgi:hypothetical protein
MREVVPEKMGAANWWEQTCTANNRFLKLPEIKISGRFIQKRNDYLFLFLCRFFLNLFLRLCVAIL